ncbi:MAG: NAD(P)H:quinone oxidoreductase [Spirochaetales bacterium]|nr:NAD(P)H:quinone oxidoreductase [Spirochaetales bacterium]
MKISVVFYSMYGHMYQMAAAAAEGVREVPGAEVQLYRVEETLPDSILEQMGALEAKVQFKDIPVATPEILEQSDGLVFGVPTRFGNMSAQMRNFFDATGGLWAQGKLIGKPASVMSSSAMQHGGQESTLLTTHVSLLHHGMLIVGLPASFNGLGTIDEVSGGSFYGASTITGAQGERMPSENELAAARFQGKRTAEIAAKLSS